MTAKLNVLPTSRAILCMVALAGVVAAQDPTSQDPQDPEVKKLQERVEKLEQEQQKKMQKLEDENEQLRKRQEILEGEVERFELRDVIPPAGSDNDFTLGLGPAGSKVYRKDQGISIGGYGEFLFTNPMGRDDIADALRVVTYIGYKFNDNFVFNSEIEVEHGSTSASSGSTSSGGSVSAEFAYLDYLHSDAINARGGLLLVPMGLINEFHEPTTFLPALRPDTERRIIPTTWREVGAGLHGGVGGFAYRAYVVNGLNGQEFDSGGLRGGRQKGNRTLANDWAGVVRVDWVDTPGLIAGGSVYFGNSGQDATVNNAALPGMFTVIAEAHAEFRHGPWMVRGLYSSAWINDAGEYNAITGENLASRLEGWYIEGGFDVLANWAPESAHSLSPYLRYEMIDTQASMPTGYVADSTEQDEITTLGLNYKPIDQIVIKTDYQFRKETPDLFNILLGYVF